MDARNIPRLVEEYKRQREALVAQFPELAEDVQALADTLEGETDAPDLIATFIRDAREDDALAAALGSIMAEQRERKARLELRAERRRAAALRIMQALALRKIEMPDFTASIRAVPSSVVVTDDNALPDSLCRFKREPDKAKIKEALAAGPVDGAHMSNGSEALALRTK